MDNKDVSILAKDDLSRQLSCIIVDDDPIARLGMVKLVERTSELNLRASLASAEEAQRWLNGNHADLIFLDIEMSGISGMDFARMLPENTRIIFTTAFREYACQSYDVGAIDYLLKPISACRFDKAVERARTALPQTPTILIRTDRRYIRVNPADIIYIEGMKDYVKIYCNDRRYISRTTIKALLNLLPPADFVRIHKSYVINVNRVKAFDFSTVELAAQPTRLSGPCIKTTLPLGAAFRRQFEQRMRK